MATAFYDRTAPVNLDFIKWLATLGKPLVIVTDFPYLISELACADSLLLIFAAQTEGAAAAARLLYGRAEATGSWPLTLIPDPRGA